GWPASRRGPSIAYSVPWSASPLQHAPHELVIIGQPGGLVDEPGAADLLARQLAGAPPAPHGDLVRRAVGFEVAVPPLRDCDQAHGPSDFMNVIQCVPPRLPDGCPNNGRSGVRASTSRVPTCTSLHLKISTPAGRSTRKHSAKPARRSARQSAPSFPYLAASQDLGPARTRCGGSNTTSGNVSSAKGRQRKSRRQSGWIDRARVPSSRCVRSVTTSDSVRR